MCEIAYIRMSRTIAVTTRPAGCIYMAQLALKLRAPASAAGNGCMQMCCIICISGFNPFMITVFSCTTQSWKLQGTLSQANSTKMLYELCDKEPPSLGQNWVETKCVPKAPRATGPRGRQGDNYQLCNPKRGRKFRERLMGGNT
jgi:hypothetical protein